MIKTTKYFSQAYSLLNKEQRLAVDTIEGPVMLVAGPGTGKTQTLALRIANILRQTDTLASNILALTYTESGARAMRTRLVGLIGPEAYYAHISTFHAFCIEVIKDNPDIFTLNPSSEPLSELEKLRLIYRFLDNTKLTSLRPISTPYYYAGAIIGAISDLKREGIDPDSFAALLQEEEQFLQSEDASLLKKVELAKRQKNLAKNLELNQIFHQYQKFLLQSNNFDFEDMINSVVDAFKHNQELLRQYQEQFLYLLVDEYQDTNSAQNSLLLQLSSFWGENANIFVTGDPDQCLPGDTLIATENGEIPIKSIQIGDKVLSAVGKGYTSYVSVTNTFKNKRLAKMITLTLETGQVITSTHNHKMFCYIPPREQTNYWYVYLMFKKGLGWRIGTTIGLSHRLKLEADADKIVGIKKCDSEAEARYFELVYSLKYQIPTVIFKFRNNMISGEWLSRLYKEFDTIVNAKKLADDLGINLEEPHYQRDGTTLGKGRIKINLYMNSRSYRTKYDNDGLLKSPSIEHELDIQTKNPEVLRILEEKGFKLRNQNIGKGFRLVSHDLSYLYKIGKELEVKLDGILDIKSSLGTHAIQHKPTRIMQAGNILEGNYLPVRVGNHIEYSKVISKTVKFEKITTYDLEVYPSHNFIANGVVVHNSIMRFQGASIANQLSFIKHYPNATTITLKQNYRSTQTILDAANSLIGHNNLRITDVVRGVDSHLQSQVGGGEKIHLAELSGGTAETIFLAQSIAAKIEAGAKPNQIAVIYHTNKEATLIADTLSKYGIDHIVQGGANVLHDPTVRNFIKILRVISELRTRSEDENLFTILHYEIFNIASLDILKIARYASDHRLKLFDVLADPSLLDTLSLDSRQQIDHFLAQISTWQQLDATVNFVEFFEAVLNESGYLRWILAQFNPHHRIARLNTLFDEVKRMNRADHSLNLDSFLANLNLMEENNLRLEESNFGVNPEAITLTTAHKSKGLEWDHVYIYRAIDSVWGNNKSRQLITLPENLITNQKLSSKEQNEDERRLFYVAITRAKSSLTLCYSKSYSSNGTAKPALPTMFLSELDDSNLEPLSVENVEQQAHKHLETLLTTSSDVHIDSAEQTFLAEIVSNFKLSATSLNAFLYCAYKFKLDKLFKVPHAKKSHLSFGTAIHKALENFYRKYKEENIDPGIDYLLAQFDIALNQSIMTSLELDSYQKKGHKVLQSYYSQNSSHLLPPLETEKNLATYLSSLPANIPQIEITGKIDRLEWADQSTQLVRVIDYKTGKAKSMGQIMGETQDSDGDLLRQLEFYKLLIDSNPTLNYKFEEAVLDFVEEPNDKSKDGKRILQISDEQVADLKKLIINSMQEINALRFPRTTDRKKCEKCYFLDHCFPDGIGE